VSKGVANGIWSKAALLVSDLDAISSAPGCGAKDNQIRPCPSLCHNKKQHQYACDDKCPQFKSFGIYLHTVAAAQTDGEQEDCMSLHRKKCVSTPNLMELAKHDMPLGAGRKGHRVPKKKVS